MLARFEAGRGYLAQDDAALGIENTFGEPWVYYNDRGGLAINRAVLSAFKKMTPGAVWDRSEKAWRKRVVGDGHKRQSA